MEHLHRNIYVQHNAEVMQMRKSLSLKSLGKEKGQQNVDSVSEDFSDKIARGEGILRLLEIQMKRDGGK